MIKFALLGAGRIGKMHANNLVLNSQSDLEVVYDVNNSAAREVSSMHNCKIAQSAEEAITNKNIDAIWIASSTPTHIQYILLAANMLFNHRLNKTGLKSLPIKCIPQNVTEAYKIQNELKLKNQNEFPSTIQLEENNDFHDDDIHENPFTYDDPSDESNNEEDSQDKNKSVSTESSGSDNEINLDDI